MTLDDNLCLEKINVKEINDFEGDVEKYFSYLGNLFEGFFLKQKVVYKGMKVEVSLKREEDGKLERFWHSISNTDYTNQQKTFPNLKRCNAIHYISILLQECANCKNHITFERKEKNLLKNYIWCLDNNVMIVLLKQRDRYRFITCFVVEGKRNIEKYFKRYQESKKIKTAT